jgi:putative ABC transport system permease protein
LIEVPGPAANADRLSAILETQLTPYGFEAERVSERLANFLAVQNTYLSTFETLGGLGLLLGTLGLATVMVRNVLERRGELALLSALGFRRSGLAWLVLVETAVLLLCGLLIGTIAALVAMIPHLSSIGADVPWGSLALILSIVFVVGMLAALAASIEAARTRILEGLRSE